MIYLFSSIYKTILTPKYDELGELMALNSSFVLCTCIGGDLFCCATTTCSEFASTTSATCPYFRSSVGLGAQNSMVPGRK